MIIKVYFEAEKTGEVVIIITVFEIESFLVVPYH